ncbi:MAG: ADOP family duplicated permease [Gemmatimonadaceae bacterium]
MSLLDRITHRLTWLGAIDVLEQDARFAWRSLRRNPAATALIVVTLTLGIGVNAATFSVLDRIYLRPPAAVVDPNNVHRIWLRFSRLEGGPQYAPSLSYPLYRVIRSAWGDSDRVALMHRVSDSHIGGTRRGTKADALYATANYWSILGLRPQLGRFYSPDEDLVRQAAAVAVLSDNLWRTQFGADSSVIGKPLRLDDQRYTIVGVAPRGFNGTELEPVSVWIPLASYPQPPSMKEPIWESHSMYIFFAIARAAPNYDLNAFARRATRAVQSFARANVSQGDDTLMTVSTGPVIFARGPGRESQEDLISTRLSAVAIIVLIIAAANVINLLLARATRRRREIAVRLALGVGRWRLVRLLTAETLLLALISATAAVLAARWGGAMLRTLLLPNVHFIDAPMDARIVAFTFALAIAAGLVAGVVPALQASNPDLTRALKEGAREGMVHRSRLRGALVVVQGALSVVLLAGAALFIESLRNVQAMDIGYDTSRTVVGDVAFDAGQEPPAVGEAARIAEVASRIGQRPGVEAVARATQVPMRGYSYAPIFMGNDSSIRATKSYPVLNVVTRSFFAATGLRLLRGNVFADQRGAPPQIVINEAMAEQLWPNDSSIGRCLRVDERTNACYTIVGIVQTARRDNITEDPVPQYYVPIANLPASLEKQFGNATALIVRSAPMNQARVAAELTNELRRAFPAGYPDVQLFSEVLEPEYRPWRVGAALFTSFGALALFVAIVGIYSTVSYGVTQRMHEFGVRIALGARVADVLRLVLGDGLRVVSLGVAIGVALALASGRLIAALLYGIEPTNLIVIAVVSVVLLLAAAIATVVPALRAGRADPITALRSE